MSSGGGSSPIRCRVDFDTSVGDETYTPLKRSSEFMLSFVNALCLASIEGVMEWRQECVVRVLEAKTELMELKEKQRILEEEEEEKRMMAGFDGEMVDTTIAEDENSGSSSNNNGSVVGENTFLCSTFQTNSLWLNPEGEWRDETIKMMIMRKTISRACAHPFELILCGCRYICCYRSRGYL